MRVLTIFIDMIRANRLSTFNDAVKVDTPLDIAFKELGGTAYTNCFTPGPDTPRGMSTYYTGVPPYLNGCNTRLKWPKYFLKKELKTVFDIFIDKNYTLDLFAAPNERDTGLFPEHIDSMDIHNHDYDLDGYLSKIKLQDDHFLFVSIPDYHWAFDDFGYSTHGEKNAYKITKSVWDIIFKNFNKDDFDHILIFSDHGFKFLSEYKTEPKAYMLNEDRTNSIMLHRKKGDNVIAQNDKLCSLADLFATYEDILSIDNTSRGISLLASDEREFIVLDDHIDFTPSINQNIELWALVTKELIYIRELDKAILIDRKKGTVGNGINEKYDNILKSSSSFSIYWEEYNKIFLYHKNIVMKKDFYTNGKSRIMGKVVLKYLFIILDIIKIKYERGINVK